MIHRHHLAMPLRIALGWDAEESHAWKIAEASLRATSSSRLDIRPISIEHLYAKSTMGIDHRCRREFAVYQRSTSWRGNTRWDRISDAPMTTSHAIARFFLKYAFWDDEEPHGWALFADGDILVRWDVAGLFALADETKAVMVVQHEHEVKAGALKKDGQTQTAYPRKNWSSVMLWNFDHPSHRNLSLETLNTVPGRYLHRFGWLPDDAIGSLPGEWNHLVGVPNVPTPHVPAIVHFTLGLPDKPGLADQPYAEEWFEHAYRCGYIYDRYGKDVVRRRVSAPLALESRA